MTLAWRYPTIVYQKSTKSSTIVQIMFMNQKSFLSYLFRVNFLIFSLKTKTTLHRFHGKPLHNISACLRWVAAFREGGRACDRNDHRSIHNVNYLHEFNEDLRLQSLTLRTLARTPLSVCTCIVQRFAVKPLRKCILCMCSTNS